MKTVLFFVLVSALLASCASTRVVEWADDLAQRADAWSEDVAQRADAWSEDFTQEAVTFSQQEPFRYAAFYPLSESWFETARRSLEEPYMYVVLSDTRSIASRVIGFFTGDPYNHASVAFDGDLKTLISFNGGGGETSPGLNTETLARLERKRASKVLVYRLNAEAAGKEKMIRRIEEINAEGSSYNVSGLITKRSPKPNIMFCSQFVYSLLDEGGIRLFDKESGKVKPMDFIKQDREGRLVLVYNSG